MATHHEFDVQAVDRAIQAAKAHHERNAPANLGASSMTLNTAGGHLRLTAECISVTVEGGQVCLSLPLGFGNVCLPMPLPLPDGTGAEACVSICESYFGPPPGVQVTVSVNGQVLVQQSFGGC